MSETLSSLYLKQLNADGIMYWTHGQQSHCSMNDTTMMISCYKQCDATLLHHLAALFIAENPGAHIRWIGKT